MNNQISCLIVGEKSMTNEINRYIIEGWQKTSRKQEWLGKSIHDDGSLYLPYSYTVPCAENTFQHLFYWDTYFACRGLLISGLEKLVEGNARNFVYLINTYGFIPNSSQQKMLNRSQPPFLAMLISDYYDFTQDKKLLEEGLIAIEKELDFWYSKRTAENGLAHYDCNDTDEVYIGAYNLYQKRTGIVLSGDKVYAGRNVFAEAESGWDFTGRFEGKCLEYNPVDLNCLLWFAEKFLAKNGINSDKYTAKANLRENQMRKLMCNNEGVWLDYCYTQNHKSPIKSCASFFPYFVGMEKNACGIDSLLNSLELEYGVQAAQKCAGNFQWGASNGWACLQLVVVEGLDFVGRKADALRIAKKYVTLVEKCFNESGHLWEKYNVLEGTSNAIGEYGTPHMLGWSAGVYQTLKKYIEN